MSAPDVLGGTRHAPWLVTTHLNPSVLAFVSDKLRARLARNLPGAVFCQSWTDLACAVQRAERSVVVLDPSMCMGAVASLTRLKQRFASTSFIIYTALDPKPFQLVVELIGAGFTDVVLFGYDDDRARLERLMQDVGLRAQLPEFIGALETQLELLPPALRSAIEDMMREPRRYSATHDLAAAAQMSTRAVFRHLKRAGFPSPRRLVASARALRAYHLLSDTGRSAHDVAARLGYASGDQLSQHLTELAGCTASDVKKGLPPDEFMEMLIASVLGSGLVAAGLASESSR